MVVSTPRRKLRGYASRAAPAGHDFPVFYNLGRWWSSAFRLNGKGGGEMNERPSYGPSPFAYRPHSAGLSR